MCLFVEKGIVSKIKFGIFAPNRTFHSKEASLFLSNITVIITTSLFKSLNVSFFYSTQLRSRFCYYWIEWNNIQHFVGSSTNGEEQWDSHSLWSKGRVSAHKTTLTASSCKQQRIEYNRNLCCFEGFAHLFPVQNLCSCFYGRWTWALWYGHTATDIK